jgi:hypothetical protein
MKTLNKVFDIQAVDVEPKTYALEVVKPKDSEEPEDEDFTYVRSNYYDIIEQGSVALSGALRVAAESENPRAYEVVSGLMKNLADVNRQLLMVGEDKQKVKMARRGLGTQQPVPGQVTNNTAVFVGNSTDISKLIADKLKAK